MKMNVQNMLGDLQAKLMENSIPFMEGRTPNKLVEGEILTICDFGFINGDDGEYVVFITKEDNEHFYFGGMVLTDLLKTVEKNYNESDVKDLLDYGIKFTTEQVKSKKTKRTYTKVHLIEE